uniref:Exocyst subunit Exo70 family protein n=1 Tax=Oryza meridionalis TaxID=40149 RepID=A0A0E0DXZ3_9ORYZ
MAIMHARFEVSDVVGGDGSSSGGSSPASVSGPSDSDGSSCSSSSAADELFPDARELPSTSASVPALAGVGFHPISPTSLSVLSDIDVHMQRMARLLPAFASPAAAPRAQALGRWLAGFDVGWVGRRVRVWAQALSTMDRVFRLRHREARNPANDAAAAQLAALGELASASAGAMLRLATAVAALGASPSALLAALDVYVPVSEAYPGLARMFSWSTAAADAALAALVDAARRCVRGLPASIRSHYPWRMPQGGEAHPCVGFWMGYFRCMLRNRVSLYLVLAGGDGDETATTPALAPGGEGGLVADLISRLEAVLEEKSGELAFPGLRQVFMLNNTHAIVRRAVRSDLAMFLPPGWARAREERMEGYVKSYLDASWAPVVSRLAAAATKPAAVSVLRRRRDPLAAFNSALENACSAQRCWKVPSPVLRRVLRRTVSEHVVPAYRRCLEEVETPAAARTVEELERQLSELFEG